MNVARYDILVAGDSLTARMVAALLAKHGKRVLLLATATHRDPWQHASLLTEQVLGLLAARDLLVEKRPVQVLSSRARVTIGQGVPLDRELKREFGSGAAPLKVLLDELERCGTLLEELFQENGGLPLDGLRNTMAWRWLCLRRKLPMAALSAPLTSQWPGLPEPAGEWLRDLFQGLSLRPLASLTMADAALLWVHIRRPKALDSDQLHRLLSKRFEQFHGIEIAVETLNALEHNHGHWSGQLPDGKRFLAGQLIIGDLDLRLPDYGPLPVRQNAPPIRHFLTSPLDGQISALLENQVIAGGTLPVRMSLLATAEGLTGNISSGPETDEAGVHNQLEPFLPFARYTLKAQATAHRLAGMMESAAPLPLFRLPIHLGNHLWCADETRLMPQLGNGGAALLAWTLAHRIDPTIISHHG